MHQLTTYLLATLLIAACSGPLQPSNKIQPPAKSQPPTATPAPATPSTLTMTVTWQDLGSLGGGRWVATAIVTDSVLKKREGQPQTFHLPRESTQTTITVTFETQGRKEVTVSLSEAGAPAVASFGIVHDATPGAQHVPVTMVAKPVLKLHSAPPHVRWRDVRAQVSVISDQSQVPPAPSVTYEDIKPILQGHCTRCHLPIARGGGLDLSAWPFTSALRDEGGEQLAARVLDRMRATSYPMPPGEPRPAEEVELIAGWISGGLGSGDDSAPGPGTGDVASIAIFYRLSGLRAENQVALAVTPAAEPRTHALMLPGLAIGQTYDLRVVLANAAGEVIQTLKKQVSVEAAGTIRIDVNVTP